MRTVKRLSALLVLLALLLSAASCSEDEREVSDYYPHHCELALTIPHDYAQFSSDEFDAAFTDGYAVVGMIRISYAAAFNGGIPTTLEPGQFADYYMRLSEREEQILYVDDVPYYSYEQSGYFYMFTFYCSKYAYFTVMYTCTAEMADEYKDDFLRYADEAYFTL